MENLPALQKNMPLVPTDHEMTTFAVMAKTAVDSKMYKGVGEQAGVMMIMLAARELGIGPFLALNGGLNIINGKTEISARLMNAMIRRSGHSIKTIESTDSICTLRGVRADNGDAQETSYSLEEAKRAGLVKPGGGWTKNPKDMCFARALSRLARQLFADVIGTGYCEGEIGGEREAWNHPFMKEPEERKQERMAQEAAIEVQPLATPLNDYTDMFPEADKLHALSYLDAVRNHFGWPVQRAIDELTKDKEATMGKFNLWKAREKIHAAN